MSTESDRKIKQKTVLLRGKANIAFDEEEALELSSSISSDSKVEESEVVAAPLIDKGYFGSDAHKNEEGASQQGSSFAIDNTVKSLKRKPEGSSEGEKKSLKRPASCALGALADLVGPYNQNGNGLAGPSNNPDNVERNHVNVPPVVTKSLKYCATSPFLKVQNVEVDKFLDSSSDEERGAEEEDGDEAIPLDENTDSSTAQGGLLGVDFDYGVPLAKFSWPAGNLPDPDYRLKMRTMQDFHQVLGVAVGAHVCKGKRNEDRYKMDLECILGGKACGIFVVADGHGGDQVVKYLEDHVVDTMLEYQEMLTSFATEMTAATRMVEHKLRANIQPSVLAECGSTCAFAIVSKKTDGSFVLNAANVGDTAVMLCRENGFGREVTVDMNVNNPVERQKALDACPTCIHTNGYVNGTIQLTGTFGDNNAKVACPNAVSAKPHTCTITLDSTDEFAFMATDGVFDAFETKQDVVNFVREKLSETKNAQATAQALTKKAKEVSLDDCTAIVIVFEPRLNA